MPKLKITLADHQEINHDLSEETVTIGRLPDNSLPVEDGSVSSHHAQLRFEHGEYEVVDLDSTNGTFVNGDQINSPTILHPGDRVRFGKVEAEFVGEAVSSSGKQPLPESGASEVTLGTASARPGGYTSASPFPKAAKTGDALSMAAVILGVLGVIGFAVATFLSLGLSANV